MISVNNSYTVIQSATPHWTGRWKLGINDKPANATNATGWGTLEQPHGEHHDGSSGETGGEAEEENGVE